jgi:hypothetical protein
VAGAGAIPGSPATLRCVAPGCDGQTSSSCPGFVFGPEIMS